MAAPADRTLPRTAARQWSAPKSQNLLFPFALILVSTLVGFAVVRAPGLAATVAGAVLIIPLVMRVAWIRLLVVVTGAFLVFQSPNDSLKIGYLSIAAICCAVSIIELQSGDEISRSFRPMFLGSVMLLGMVGASLFNALQFGAVASNWFRDALPYILLAILPLVGLDAARKVSTRFLGTFIGWSGVVAAIGFALDWLNRRGATEGTGRVVLATAAFSIFAFAFAFVRAGIGPHRLRWSAVAFVIVAALLLTGTRTNIVLIAAAVVGATGFRKRSRVPARRTLALLAGGGAAVALALPFLANRWLTNTAFLQRRTEALVSVIRGGVRQDQSFELRASSYDLAKRFWKLHPWFGGGPGHLYAADTLSLDTPFVVLGKFGVIGTIVLVGYFVSVLVSIRRLARFPHPGFTTGRSWAFCLVALLPFGAWTEDKGASLALTVLIALVAAAARENGMTANDLAHPSTRSLPTATPQVVSAT